VTRENGQAIGQAVAGRPSPRPRDSQRARLYRAEAEVDPGRSIPTVSLLQAYVDELVGNRWFEDRWGARVFEVRPGHGHRRATADDHGVLQMPRWARTELILLHEVAHCLAPAGCAPHGPQYAGVLVCLVRRRMGLAAAQALEDAFVRQRVRWSPVLVPGPVAAEGAPPC
jgi:putative metallohydrolase (TIGR04338 family)